MKKSALKEYIREEIIKALSEETIQAVTIAEKEEDDVEKEDDWYKSKDEDGDKDKEPSKSELKKVDKSTKGLAKAKDELALLTREMKALAKKYKEAKGEEKAMIFTNLSKKTAHKNELEAIVYPKSQSEIY